MENKVREHARKLIEKDIHQPFLTRRSGKWLQDNFFLIRHEDEELPSVDWVLNLVKAAVMRHGIHELVIDPYNELDHQRPENQTEMEYVSQMFTTWWWSYHNRKLADHLEDYLWHNRLNSYSAESAISAVGERGYNQLMEKYNHLTDPAQQVATGSLGFVLQRNQNDDRPGQDLLMHLLLQQLMSLVEAFRCSDNATMAAFLSRDEGW
uniref:Uncharacterized protein n=1 Tax=Physcomitrium patens TaxID=3218 RepID=A0A2K1IRG4_PHYPA|nr:hypothetical protein PHYPA_025997 [Physcomitrium patens]